jgi:hypothetical protein
LMELAAAQEQHWQFDRSNDSTLTSVRRISTRYVRTVLS